MKLQNFDFEYDEKTHTYLADGVIVPSVTQILKATRFQDKYAGVDEETLRAAAERGTKVHADIEAFCQMGIESGTEELHNFKLMKSLYNFDVIDNEVPILITKDGEPVAAGRLDLVMRVNGEPCLGDIKTTATLDKAYLFHQLNFYRVGYMQTYKKYIGGLYGLHIRKDKRRFNPVRLNDGVVWETLKEFKEVSNE